MGMSLYVLKDTRETVLKNFSIHSVKQFLDYDISKLRAWVLKSVLGLEINVEDVVMVHVTYRQDAFLRFTFDIIYTNGKRDVVEIAGNNDYVVVKHHRFESFNV